MSYEKTIWATGDKITAEKMNKIEEGIASGTQGQKGDTGEAGPQGQKGDTGETGPQGAAGADAVITPAAAVADLATDADATAITASVNSLLTNLRAAGLLAMGEASNE